MAQCADFPDKEGAAWDYVPYLSRGISANNGQPIVGGCGYHSLGRRNGPTSASYLGSFKINTSEGYSFACVPKKVLKRNEESCFWKKKRGKLVSVWIWLGSKENF